MNKLKLNKLLKIFLFQSLFNRSSFFDTIPNKKAMYFHLFLCNLTKMILIDFSAFFYSIFYDCTRCLFVCCWMEWFLWIYISVTFPMIVYATVPECRVQRWEILETDYVIRICFLHKNIYILTYKWFALQESIKQTIYIFFLSIFFEDIFMEARMLCGCCLVIALWYMRNNRILCSLRWIKKLYTRLSLWHSKKIKKYYHYKNKQKNCEILFEAIFLRFHK